MLPDDSCTLLGLQRKDSKFTLLYNLQLSEKDKNKKNNNEMFVVMNEFAMINFPTSIFHGQIQESDLIVLQCLEGDEKLENVLKLRHYK